LFFEFILLTDQVVALVQLENDVVAGKQIVATEEALAQVLGLLGLQLRDDLTDPSMLL
jgi:hypothetical protein